jgi:hypothetical protein
MPEAQTYCSLAVFIVNLVKQLHKPIPLFFFTCVLKKIRLTVVSALNAGIFDGATPQRLSLLRNKTTSSTGEA